MPTPDLPIIINDIEFTKRDDCNYKNNYVFFARVLSDQSLWHEFVGADPKLKLTIDQVQRSMFRHLILTDLFFIVYFVIGIKIANHPFVVKMCREVEDGPRTKTLDVWSRWHFKSTIITIAETVQYHLINPEHCTCIFSYKKPAAEDFLDSVRKTLEKPIVKFSFPDIVYENPAVQAPSWSLQNGIILKRKNTSRKEKTVEASGLVEGMSTGAHYERRIFDDFETADIQASTDEQNKVYDRFEMASFLGTGTDDEIERVIGTFYSHSGPLVRIREKKKFDGTPEYISRIVPCTDTGTEDGKPVLMSLERLNKEKMGLHFDMQMLCDPTPKKSRKLNPDYLTDIEPEMIPRSVLKLLMVDPAGDDKGKGGCDWAIGIIGVDPKPDELGASNVYIMQAMIEELKETEAPDIICRMYMAGGIIQKVAVEKVGQSTTEIHVANALKMRGKRISTDDGSLVILTPKGRPKDARIVSLLAWPLSNGKVFISTAVPSHVRQRIRDEMGKFPYWKKDGLDMLAYTWDVINDLDLTRLYTVGTETRFIRTPHKLKTAIA